MKGVARVVLVPSFRLPPRYRQQESSAVRHLMANSTAAYKFNSRPALVQASNAVASVRIVAGVFYLIGGRPRPIRERRTTG